MKNIKKQVCLFCLLNLIVSAQLYAQNVDPDDNIEQGTYQAEQVDPCVDAASQGESDSADRLTEVEVHTPLVYLKMLSDDPVTQAIIGLLGAVSLMVIMHQLYEHVVQ